MHEFNEKLISRLEEEAFSVQLKQGIKEPSTYDAMLEKFSVLDIKNIVNQLAEEYSENIIIDGQYCWQTCACVEKCKECQRLCDGDIDWYENIEDWND